MRREGAEWKQIFQIIDAAYADYLTGMAALRKRVVDDKPQAERWRRSRPPTSRRQVEIGSGEKARIGSATTRSAPLDSGTSGAGDFAGLVPRFPAAALKRT